MEQDLGDQFGCIGCHGDRLPRLGHAQGFNSVGKFLRRNHDSGDGNRPARSARAHGLFGLDRRVGNQHQAARDDHQDQGYRGTHKKEMFA